MAMWEANVVKWEKCALKGCPDRSYLFETSPVQWNSCRNDQVPINTSIQRRIERLQATFKTNQLQSSANDFTERSWCQNEREAVEKGNGLSLISSAPSKSIKKIEEKTVRGAPKSAQKRKSSTQDPTIVRPTKVLKTETTQKTSTNHQTKASEYSCKTALSGLGKSFANKIKQFCQTKITSGPRNTVQFDNTNEDNNNNLVVDKIVEHPNKTYKALKRLNEKKFPKSLHGVRNSTAIVGYEKWFVNNKRFANFKEFLQQRAVGGKSPVRLKSWDVNCNTRNNGNEFSAKGATSSHRVEPADWETVENTEREKGQEDVPYAGQRMTSPRKEWSPYITTLKMGTMGDVYDTMNENLLRISADGKKTDNKWLSKCYYFVLDTNVLLRDICFVEDTLKMKFCDTQGSVLFIPYCVLHELDKLKQRSGAQRGVKILAIRAIKFLNEKFQSKSPYLQAQCAIDECQYMIKISSPDDSIINSCLQVKLHIPNIILLTEDINLRNKAISNNIPVSTKSDLLAKPYDKASNAKIPD
uniref:PINc domain-containing protein n=1 Tax=Glossina austeni TaxID=7395 RepID=A0A1A9V015_GLOAU